MAGTAEGRYAGSFEKEEREAEEKRKKREREPEGYKGGKDVPPGSGTYHNPNPTNLPPVPKKTGDSTGRTTVHTPSMVIFAKNIETLLDPCKKAQQVLKNVKVAPGDFFHGHAMRAKVAGGTGAGGCQEAYLKVLDDLCDGLTSLANGVRLMGQKYDSTDEANNMTGKQLKEYLRDAAADFGALAQDTRP